MPSFGAVLIVVGIGFAVLVAGVPVLRSLGNLLMALKSHLLLTMLVLVLALAAFAFAKGAL